LEQIQERASSALLRCACGPSPQEVYKAVLARVRPDQYDPRAMMVNPIRLLPPPHVAAASSDAAMLDPAPAVHKPKTAEVVDEGRDDDLPRPADGARRFGHHRHMASLFTEDGNWVDTGTAVAADQYAGMTPSQQAEFLRKTGLAASDVRPGDASLMQVPATKSFDGMNAPRPEITYREIDFSRIGKVTIEPKKLVIHYTAGVEDTPDSVWKRFNDLRGVPSTHYIVGKQGDILQTMQETQLCDGTLDYNDESIQIEVCGDFRKEQETEPEFASTVALVRYLQKKYRIADTQIISHRQVDNTFGHPGRKPDPTFRFMNRLYRAIKEPTE
jgi:hypothetical protein